MGCDIHTVAQKKTAAGWEDLDFRPFDWRSYGMFGFLAGVRNYSAVAPIAEKRGLPDDFDADRFDCSDYHSRSWLSVDELTAFDYDQKMEDRRVTRQVAEGWYDGGQTAEPGGGVTMTYREFLGESFFADLLELQDIGADRIVFAFDN
jgi:hypothetical protein